MTRTTKKCFEARNLVTVVIYLFFKNIFLTNQPREINQRERRPSQRLLSLRPRWDSGSVGWQVQVTQNALGRCMGLTCTRGGSTFIPTRLSSWWLTKILNFMVTPWDHHFHIFIIFTSIFHTECICWMRSDLHIWRSFDRELLDSILFLQVRRDCYFIRFC